ncbi:PREDICTED: cleavage stimulation factor subunit 1-like [Acropora digitifera]|uniref:cleavage stimulation factor subunit 1-like n=1 Tax=Acropora digitifera TaxID=70779 RepID=UPI00077AFBC5|nr:PREDICTED: cleavage stimulation factor subunit 1-like [Acropora digitifera]
MAAMTDSLKERENLYKLMISQLRYDGFESIASTLSKVVNIISACPPMARLHQVVNLGIQAEAEGARPEQPAVPGLTPQVETNRGIDLEYEPEGNEASGEWQRSSSADELFMSNLELQKIDREAGKGKEDDSPSADAVIQHIFKITSNRKLSHFSQLRDPKSLSQASNNLTTQNSDVVDAEGICEKAKIELNHGTSPPAAMYETYYVTAHKGPCRTASFSQNGRLIATGSMDASIKVLDVERMVAKNTMPQSQDQSSGTNLENHPVIRTLYDHMEEVTSVEFHPSALVLASGSKDCTVKLFDISKPSVKKAYRSIQEAEVVTSMSFHPTGDFILVGTEHPTIRLYDTNTGQCFVSANPREYHTGPINMVMYSPTANLFASCSKDGAIKVYSICFSQNSKYVVSSGNDSLVFLWELSTGKALNMYTGATMSNYRTQVVFNHTEDFMFVADESNNSIACWDTRTTEKLKTLSSGHNNHIRCLTHSPTGAAFVSCSDDYRARFWYCQGV